MAEILSPDGRRGVRLGTLRRLPLLRRVGLLPGEREGKAELDETGAGEHINDLSLRYDGKPFHTPVDRLIVRIKPERVLNHGIDD